MDVNQKLVGGDFNDVGGESRLMKWAAAIMLTIMFFVVLASVVLWVIVHPKTLEYTIENASIFTFDLTTSKGAHADPSNVTNSFNLTAVQNPNVTSFITADFNFDMSIRNPNHRFSLTYGSMQVHVLCQNETVATQEVEGFFLKNKSYWNLTLTPKTWKGALRWPVSKEVVEMKHDRIYIKVDLTLSTNINFTAPNWKKPGHCQIKIYCADVLAQLLPVNSFSERTRCTVHWVGAIS